MDEKTTNKAILINYRFTDETNETNTRTSYVVVYDTRTEWGKKMEAEFELDEAKDLDDLLMSEFEIKDDDVVFYVANPISNDPNDYLKNELAQEEIELVEILSINEMED